MAAAVGIALAATAAAAAESAYDLVVRGGTIVDGSGLVPYSADIGIRDGYLVAIGTLEPSSAARVIDATGLMVAPGFINIHSHADAAGASRAVNTLTQGVTTEIANADGLGSVDLLSQLSTFEQAGMAENVGLYIGFNAVWQHVLGQADRRPSDLEIERMRDLVEQGFRQGAWGLSAGLDYKPAYYASTAEVMRIAAVARAWRTNFANHERLRPEEGYSSIRGIRETIEIGRESGLTPVITHIKTQGREQGSAPAVIEMMREATREGVYTPADVYPYLAGQSGLAALLLPSWALEGGREAVLGRFADPAQRTQIAAAAEDAMNARFGGPGGIFVINRNAELTALMAEWQVSAGEAVIRLLESGDMGAILRFGIEEDLLAFMQYPDTAIACDCGATNETRVHPRQYGSYPRVLGRYVRELGALSWEEAIRKMTALPAATIGLVDRGYLAPGMRADITVFDPATIADRATYEAPATVSRGIRHVIVNGALALADGDLTGETNGQALRRGRHMPTRPMSRGERRISAMGRISTGGRTFAISLAATQSSGAPFAAGHLQMLEEDTGTLWTAQQLGVVQVGPGWASLTAVLRGPDGDRKAATLILDTTGAPEPGEIALSLGGDDLVSGAATSPIRVQFGDR